MTPTAKNNGIKLVVRKKQSVKRKFPERKKCGLPCSTASSSSTTLESAAATETESTLENKDGFDDNDECLDPFFNEEIPCDSLLAMRSLIQAQRCLFIPLHAGGGMVSCILESQVYSTLKSEDGCDSIATTELRDLLSTNKVRQLLSHNRSDGITVLLESHQYRRAVWDAHRHSQDISCANVTGWFLASLDAFTGRTVSRDELVQAWDNGGSGKIAVTFSDALDKLVQMQVLLPSKQNDQSYLFWLPHWGTVLHDMAKVKQRVIGQIKRSQYKELPLNQVEYQNFPGMSSKFVLDWMVAQQFVVFHSKPSGVFLRLPKEPKG